MMENERWQKKRVLITVRTYPAPSKNSIEVSCTAAITENGQWIRLYPIPYRFLHEDKRFSKYQYIEARITKASSDPRPESFRVDPDSIRILTPPLSSGNGWALRKAQVLPLASKSLCGLQDERDRDGKPTLGLFRPKRITSLKLEATTPEWEESELARLRQYPLFGNTPKRELVKLPYVFKYEFVCDDPACKSHSLSCTDWEMGASFLKWRTTYGSKWEEKFRERYERDMTVKNDTYFYVGTLRDHPGSWIIVGLFYPPK